MRKIVLATVVATCLCGVYCSAAEETTFVFHTEAPAASESECAATTDTKSEKAETTTVAPATTEKTDDKSETEAVAETEESDADDVIDNELYQDLVDHIVKYCKLDPEFNLDLDDITDDNKESFEEMFLAFAEDYLDLLCDREPTHLDNMMLNGVLDQKLYGVCNTFFSQFSMYETVYKDKDNALTAESFEEVVTIFEEHPSKFLEDVKVAVEAETAK